MIEPHLCTLQQARDEMGADNATDLDYTFRTLPQMGVEIQNHKHAVFEPVYRTVRIYPSPVTVRPGYRVLKLIDPVNGWDLHALDITVVQNGNRALAWGEDVEFHMGRSDELYMLKACDLWERGAAGCSTTRQPYAVELTGWFGYRQNYPLEGWHLVDHLNYDIDESVLQMEVVGTLNATGFDARSPRFSPGHLLKIVTGEAAELVRVMLYAPEDIDGSVMPIRRGENNSTPIPHVAGDEIYVWSVQPEVIQAMQRWVDLRYDRRGTFDTRVIQDGAAVDHPGDMPEDVRKILWRLQI